MMNQNMQSNPSDVPEIHLRRFSSLRLRSPFASRSLEIFKLASDIFNQIGAITGLYQSFLDDTYRDMSELEFWAKAIQDGEVMLIYAGKGGRFLGVAFLSNIKPGASCQLSFLADAPLLPSILYELLGYIFGGDLGCAKAVMKVRPEDRTMLALGQNMGFSGIMLHTDVCYNGAPSPMILMELLNPALFSNGEDLDNAASRSEQPERGLRDQSAERQGDIGRESGGDARSNATDASNTDSASATTGTTDATADNAGTGDVPAMVVTDSGAMA